MQGKRTFPSSFQIIAIFLGTALFIWGGIHFWRNSESKQVYDSDSQTKPWIEITNSSVYLLRDDGSNNRELHTGDEISSGNIIRSSATGKAIIHFPDGSLLRLDKESAVTIDRADYDFQKEELIVRISVVYGRVWSKVIALVTPNSLWEVKTPNSASSVKGTAFMTEYKNGKTKVLVTNHSVLVKAINQKTKSPVEDSATIIKENNFADISNFIENSSATSSIAIPTEIEVKQVTKSILSDSWISENIIFDKKIDEKVTEIKKNGGEESVVREELRKETSVLGSKSKALRAKNKTDKEIQAEIKKEIDSGSFMKIDTKKEETPETNKSESGGGGALNQNTNIYPTELKLINAGLSKIEDGKKITLQTLLYMSDGSKKDVTEKVVWLIEGNIGFMESPSVFSAKIRDEDSETGEILGKISASISINGETFTSNKLDITIYPKVEETIPLGFNFEKESDIL